MKREGKQSRILARAALIAAALALMVVTVSASETVQNWFLGFFTNWGEGKLSQGQVEFIENNVQPILESKTIDGWTVELRSAITDGVSGYVLFHIEGPENVDFSRWKDENGDIRGQLLFGNCGVTDRGNRDDLFFEYQEELKYGGWGFYPMDDRDGMENTADLLVTLSPDVKEASIDPFGPEAVYHFNFKNIVWYYPDMAYEEELRNTKYAGQNGIRFTAEELRRIDRWDMLAEGIWEFEIIFSELDCSKDYVELLCEPIMTTATVFGEKIDDPITMEKVVEVTSVQLRNLSLTISCSGDIPVASFDLGEERLIEPCLVLNDGTEIKMVSHGSTGSGVISMYLEQPIVFAEVDYIRMADGTIIPMPEITE